LGSRGVSGLVLDPEPEYYREHFGFFPAWRLGVNESGDDYRDLISYEPPKSPADALMYRADVLMLFSTSGSIVAWAQRELELGVLGLFDVGQSTVALPAQIPWHSALGAAELMSPLFVTSKVPRRLRSALLRNYGVL
jgi:hypothetical protein